MAPAERADSTTTSPAGRAARRTSPLAWLVATVIGATVLLTIGPALVGRGLLIDVDLLHIFMPFRADGPVPEAAMKCRGDTVDYYLPGVANIVEAAKQGNWLTWAPYEVGGAPLASLPNHAVLSPVSWPYWVFPLWLAPAFVMLSMLVVAVSGMMLFLGRHGVRRSVGALAGLVFFSCGFMVMWANWPHPKVAVFFPLLLWALDRVVRERSPRDVALVGLIVMSMLFGGFPAVSLFGLTVGAVYVLVIGARLGSWPHRLTAWAGAAAGVALGVGLSAVQILPFAANIGTLGLEDRRHRPSREFDALLTALAPDAYGNCATERWFGSANAIESITYLGAGALVLVVCAFSVRLGRRRAMPWPVLLGCLLIATTWLIWVGGTLLELLQKLPGYDTNSIGRASSVFGFLGAALAGIGLERLLRRADEAPEDAPARASVRTRLLLLIPAVAFGVIIVLLVRAGYPLAQEAERVDYFSDALVLPLVLLAVGAAGAAGAVWLPVRWRPLGIVILVLVVAVQGVLFLQRMLPLSDRDNFYPVTPGHAYLQEHIGHDRYAGGAAWGYAATSDLYHLRVPVGHEFTSPEWKELLAAVSPDIQVTRTYSQFPATLPSATIGDSPILDQMAVRYWAVPPGYVHGALDPVRLRRPRGVVAMGDGEVASCEIPGGPLRGIEFAVRPPRVPPQDERALLHLRATQGDTVVESTRAITETLRSRVPLRAGLPGEGFSADAPIRMEVWFTGNSGPINLLASDGGPACRAVRAADDGLRLVHVDAGSTIYERLTALPRVRWASRALVVEDADTRLAMLADGIDPETVLLEEGAPTVAEGDVATDLEIIRDEAEAVEVAVDGEAPGYVVFADSIARDGWKAYIDGREAPVLKADHAFAAVAVPAGQHRVEVRYDAPSLRAGAILSAASALLTVLLLMLPWLRRRRRARDGDRKLGEQPSDSHEGSQ